MRIKVAVFFSCLLQSTLATQHLLNGIAYGYNATGYDIVNNWIGQNLTLVQLYDNWCGSWIWDYPYKIWSKDSGIPMISFQPEQPSCGNTPVNMASLVAEGVYDAYLNQFIQQAKLFLSGPNGVYGDADDRRIFMRFAHEMNGNWYPWSGNTTAYVLMWQHVWKLFTAAGVNNTRMQWVWCVNWQDIPASFPMEAYYPGDAFVDWVSIDGYNDGNSESWSHWMEPSDVFSDMVKRLTALTPSKPIGIAEVGCSSNGTTPSMKAQWISDLYQYVLQMNIKFLMWFDDEKGFTDYGVFNSRFGTSSYVSPIDHQSYLVYEEYATQVIQSALPVDPNNPRIITDEQFAGDFS